MMSIYDILLYIAIAIVCVLFFSGVYCFLLIAFKVPSKKTTNAIKAIASRNRPSSSALSSTYNDIAVFVSKMIQMSDYRQVQMAQSLKIANINMPPKLYEARAIVKMAGISLLAIPVYIVTALMTAPIDNAYIKAVPFVFAALMVVMGVLTFTDAHEKN